MNRQHRVTAETVGQHFREATSATRERLFELVTDGELVERSVRDFRYWEELADTAIAVIEAEKDRPFFGRATCAGIMSKVTNHFVREHGRVFKAWLKIRTELQQTPGPCNIVARDPEPPRPSWVRIKPNHSLEVLPEGILCESYSALNDARGADSLLLQDLEPMLIERARQHGVPTGWADGIAWLDRLMAERPDLAPRLKRPRDQLAALVDLPVKDRTLIDPKDILTPDELAHKGTLTSQLQGIAAD